MEFTSWSGKQGKWYQQLQLAHVMRVCVVEVHLYLHHENQKTTVCVEPLQSLCNPQRRLNHLWTPAEGTNADLLASRHPRIGTAARREFRRNFGSDDDTVAGKQNLYNRLKDDFCLLVAQETFSSGLDDSIFVLTRFLLSLYQWLCIDQTSWHLDALADEYPTRPLRYSEEMKTVVRLWCWFASLRSALQSVRITAAY